MASGGIKLPLLPERETTNRQYSVSSQFHHAAHGYTLSNGGGEGTLVRVGAERGYYVLDGVKRKEGPLVRVQRGSLGPVLRLPVEVEWGGWGGDEAVCSYDPDMFYDESGALLPWTVSPFEMDLHPSEIWRLIEYYSLYCAQESTSNPALQCMYEELRDSVLKRAVAALERQEAAAAAAAATAAAEEEQNARKKVKCDAPITSSAYWVQYLMKAEAEREAALRAATAEGKSPV